MVELIDQLLYRGEAKRVVNDLKGKAEIYEIEGFTPYPYNNSLKWSSAGAYPSYR